MTATKIYLETPNDIHGEIKRIQLDKQVLGDKANLREIYYELLRLGLESYKQQKTTS
jgi:hypothetical protein